VFDFSFNVSNPFLVFFNFLSHASAIFLYLTPVEGKAISSLLMSMTSVVFVVMDIFGASGIVSFLWECHTMLPISFSNIKESRLTTLLDLNGVNSPNPRFPRGKCPPVRDVLEGPMEVSDGKVSFGSMSYASSCTFLSSSSFSSLSSSYFIFSSCSFLIFSCSSSLLFI
jgi:hypothetical protein